MPKPVVYQCVDEVVRSFTNLRVLDVSPVFDAHGSIECIISNDLGSHGEGCRCVTIKEYHEQNRN